MMMRPHKATTAALNAALLVTYSFSFFYMIEETTDHLHQCLVAMSAHPEVSVHHLKSDNCFNLA